MTAPVHVPCPACGARNRVPAGRFGEEPVCGKCKAPLLPDPPPALSSDTFARYLERSDLPVLVDFWADWCGPCRAMAPHFAEAARTMRGRALFAKLDTEAAPDVAARYGIRSIPTLILFRAGAEAARASGAMQASQLVAWLGTAGC